MCEWQSPFKWHFPFNQGLKCSNGAKVNTGNEKPTSNCCTLRAANSMIQWLKQNSNKGLIVTHYELSLSQLSMTTLKVNIKVKNLYHSGHPSIPPLLSTPISVPLYGGQFSLSITLLFEVLHWIFIMQLPPSSAHLRTINSQMTVWVLAQVSLSFGIVIAACIESTVDTSYTVKVNKHNKKWNMITTHTTLL